MHTHSNDDPEEQQRRAIARRIREQVEHLNALALTANSLGLVAVVTTSRATLTMADGSTLVSQRFEAEINRTSNY